MALTVLATAIASHERVRFAYHTGGGTQTRRLTEPRNFRGGERHGLAASDRVFPGSALVAGCADAPGRSGRQPAVDSFF